MENLGEASGLQPATSRQEAVVQLQAARGPSSGPTPEMPVKKCLEAKISFPFWGLFLTRLSVFVSSDGAGKSTGGSEEEDDEALETLKFNFNIESLGLVLYNNIPKQVSGTRSRSRRRFSAGFLLKNLVLISLHPFFRGAPRISCPSFHSSLNLLSCFRINWSRINIFRICWSRISCCMISCFRASLVSGFWNDCSCSCSHQSSSTRRSFSWESLLSVS